MPKLSEFQDLINLDRDNDLVAVYDASTGKLKKLPVADIAASAGGGGGSASYSQTVAAFLASSETSRGVGEIWEAWPYQYEELASGSAAAGNVQNNVGVWFKVLPDNNGHLNIEAFGAVGDGSLGGGDPALLAFRAASQYVEWGGPTSGSTGNLFETAPTVYVPAGIFNVTQKLPLTSKVRLTGAGRMCSVLELDSTASDSVLIELAPNENVVTLHTLGGIDNISLQTTKTTDVSAIKPASGITVVSSGNIENLGIFSFRRGVDMFPAYAQMVHVRDLFTAGNCEQAIRMTGNVNLIEDIERGPPVTAPANGLPWILITPDDGNGGVAEGASIGGLRSPGHNVVRRVLVQQVMDSGQTCMRFERNDNVVVELGWEEVTAQKRVLDFQDCQLARLDVINLNSPESDLIRVQDTYLSVDRYKFVGSIHWWHQFLIVGDSHVHIKEIDGYLDAQIPIGDSRITVETFFSQNIIDAPRTGIRPMNRNIHAMPANNLVFNGNFAAGTTGWQTVGTLTKTVNPSFYGNGQSIALTSSTAGSHRLQQTFTVTADQVGQEFTVTMIGKQTGGSTGVLSIFTEGAGISGNNVIGVIYPEQGLQSSSVTFVPQSASNIIIGARVSNPQAAETYHVEEITVQAGPEKAPVSSLLGSVQLQSLNPGLFRTGQNGPCILAGTGSPEGVIDAPIMSLWIRTDGGAGTGLYQRETLGASATGWVAK